LKVFLAAVAIVDDLGAVLVIALFYSGELNVPALSAAGGVFAVLVALNLLRMRTLWIYLVLGALLWLAVLKSGVHATVAGVLLALTIPDRKRIDEHEFYEFCRRQLGRLERGDRDDDAPGELTERQQDVVDAIEEACEAVQTPLRRLEHALVPWVAFLIMPIFALANAGVSLRGQGGDLAAVLLDPVKVGIFLGLTVGKPVGVFGLAWLAVTVGLARLPSAVGWRTLFGACLLCGIGFTMALFIAELAFEGTELLDAAKLGVLAGSLVAGAAGLFWVFGPGARAGRREPAAEAVGSSNAG
jgi:NhaA family Na+:H+ antiporter